jgi:hypothetical protein
MLMCNYLPNLWSAHESLRTWVKSLPVARSLRKGSARFASSTVGNSDYSKHSKEVNKRRLTPSARYWLGFSGFPWYSFPGRVISRKTHISTGPVLGEHVRVITITQNKKCCPFSSNNSLIIRLAPQEWRSVREIVWETGQVAG